MKFILFITLLGTFGCYSDDLAEQHCHIILKEVKNQINEEKKINESDASNSITIDIIQDNWKNFIDK